MNKNSDPFVSKFSVKHQISKNSEADTDIGGNKK